MTFPLGKPILVMGFISLLGGAWYALQPDPPRKQLTLWVFAKPQFDHYNDELRPAFEQQFDKSVEVDLISSMAMDMRLPVLFMGQKKSAELPDAVEVEIGSMGRYLRPPVDQIGFLPLNHYLESNGFREISSLDAPGQKDWNARLTTNGKIYTFDGARWVPNPARTRPDAWRERILPNRLLTSTKNGQIFGIPHDVHPVALAFREDLFREAGVPLDVPLIGGDGKASIFTWAEFQEMCLKYQAYWRTHGYLMRHAIQLPESGSGMLSIMLLQRHINLIDTDYTIHINDPKVAQALALYVQLVAGDRKINTEAADPTTREYYADLANGNFGAFLMPDWQMDYARKLGPENAGKIRIIPLPRFDRADARTATYGGTLICIPRDSPHPDEAWKLIEFLYLSPQGLAGRDKIGILPPLPEEWDKPQYHQPDPFFGGQSVLGLCTDLAHEAPPAYMTPITGIALGTLSYVQSKAVEYLKSHGPAGLERQCQLWLDEAAVDLKARIEHVRFD